MTTASSSRVLKRGRRAVNFRLIAEQWDRIGQFYAAFPAGHATASAALQRLNRFQASNRFYAANRELGRALKTEFVLQYMSEPQLRAKVRRGLLKVEQLHALARAVYYWQRGRISACLLAGPGDLTAGRRAELSRSTRPGAVTATSLRQPGKNPTDPVRSGAKRRKVGRKLAGATPASTPSANLDREHLPPDSGGGLAHRGRRRRRPGRRGDCS